MRLLSTFQVVPEFRLTSGGDGPLRRPFQPEEFFTTPDLRHCALLEWTEFIVYPVPGLGCEGMACADDPGHHIQFGGVAGSVDQDHALRQSKAGQRVGHRPPLLQGIDCKSGREHDVHAAVEVRMKVGELPTDGTMNASWPPRASSGPSCRARAPGTEISLGAVVTPGSRRIRSKSFS